MLHVPDPGCRHVVVHAAGVSDFSIPIVRGQAMWSVSRQRPLQLHVSVSVSLHC